MFKRCQMRCFHFFTGLMQVCVNERQIIIFTSTKGAETNVPPSHSSRKALNHLYYLVQSIRSVKETELISHSILKVLWFSNSRCVQIKVTVKETFVVHKKVHSSCTGSVGLCKVYDYQSFAQFDKVLFANSETRIYQKGLLYTCGTSKVPPKLKL